MPFSRFGWNVVSTSPLLPKCGCWLGMEPLSPDIEERIHNWRRILAVLALIRDVNGAFTNSLKLWEHDYNKDGVSPMIVVAVLVMLHVTHGALVSAIAHTNSSVWSRHLLYYTSVLYNLQFAGSMQSTSSPDLVSLLKFLIGKLAMTSFLHLWLFRQVSLLMVLSINAPIFISATLCYIFSSETSMDVLIERWRHLLLSLFTAPSSGILPACLIPFIALDHFRWLRSKAINFLSQRGRPISTLSARPSISEGAQGGNDLRSCSQADPLAIGKAVPSVPEEQVLELGIANSADASRMVWELTSERTIESAESGTPGMLAHSLCHGVAQEAISHASGRAPCAKNTTRMLDAELSELVGNSRASENSETHIMLPGQPLDPGSYSVDSLNSSVISGPVQRGQILSWCHAALEFFAERLLVLDMERKLSVIESAANVYVQLEFQSRKYYTIDDEDYEFVRDFISKMDRSPEGLVSWIVHAMDPKRAAKTHALARNVAIGFGNLLADDLGSSAYVNAANPFLPPFDADRSTTASTVASSYEIL